MLRASTLERLSKTAMLIVIRCGLSWTIMKLFGLLSSAVVVCVGLRMSALCVFSPCHRRRGSSAHRAQPAPLLPAAVEPVPCVVCCCVVCFEC